MSKPLNISRRSAVKTAAAAAALPLVHIRTAGAAGKLNIGFWDHWVPGANAVMQKHVDAWAEKNKVEVNADFITSSGGKLQLTPAAETQAKAGHDAARGKDPADFQKDHHDRLCAIEAKLGIAHKADGMKSEDQGGSGKPVRARH